jgi:shikimate kinase
MKIFLVGYMGSGKTTVGRMLAEMMDFEFIDLDKRIETSFGRSIPEIFFHHGEQAFRVHERECLHHLLNETIDCVVATGGGTPCFFDSMILMKEAGKTIYLKCSPEILFERLRGSSSRRPLLSRLTDSEKLNYIAKHIHERNTFYESAEWVINGDENAITVAEAVRSKINEISRGVHL